MIQPASRGCDIRDDAPVAFRIAAAPVRNRNDSDRPEVQPGCRLVWEARFSDGKVRERSQLLAPRQRVERDRRGSSQGAAGSLDADTASEEPVKRPDNKSIPV
jgi:hypothetical protein